MSAAKVSQVDELAFLKRLLSSAATATDHLGLLKAVIDDTRAATGSQVCSLYLWQEGTAELVLTATNGLSQSGIGKVRLRIGEGVTGWVAETRSPLVVTDTRSEPRFVWVPGLDQERFVSMLSVPLITADRLVGVINVQTERAHEFIPEEVAFLEAIGGHVAGIVERSALLHEVSSLHQQRTEILMMLAHDIGTPLSIARSYLTGVRDRVGPKLKGPVAHAEAELARVESQCRKALESLRLESARWTVHRVPTDPRELVKEAARRLRAVADEGRIETRLPASAPQIACDAEAVQEALINLGDNALKYSPKFSPVTLGLRVLTDSIVFEVRDRGRGLDAATQAQLAQPFHRGKTEVPGTGLGLFIARRIAEGHGGRLRIRSGSGRGSTFGIELPC